MEDFREDYREEQIDLRDYLRVLMKRRWIILCIFFVVVLTVAVNTYTAVPIYRATARIQIERQQTNPFSNRPIMPYYGMAMEYYQTQSKIITSRAVADKVVRRLNLQNSPEFFPPPRDDVISNAKRWVRKTLSGFKIRLKTWIKSILKIEKSRRPRIDSTGGGKSQYSPLAGALLGRVSVNPVRDTQLLDISVMGVNPALAARMANEMVQAYIDHTLENRLEAAKNAVQWLGERISEERKKVEDAENTLLRYKEEQGIITSFSSDSENITAQKLATLNNQVVQAESARVEAETRYRQALELGKSSDMLDAIPEVLTNELIREIKKMEVGLYNRMSELSKKYGRKHPQMVAIDSELAELKKRKIREVKRVVNSLRNEFKLALAREESLKKALAKQKKESLELNKKAVHYGVLQRQAVSSRHMYDLLIKRFKETSLTEEIKTANIRIIDSAEVPRGPIKPNKRRNILLAIVVGLTLGIGLAFLLEYLDNTIKFPEEIKNYLKIPYLGPVPAYAVDDAANGNASDLITLQSPKSTASESFRGIRTGILYSLADRPPQVILVTSAGPSEGKTVCAANLAVTMAQSGSRVLLIDCDMRRPRVHKMFDKSREDGLSSVLVGDGDARETIIKTGVENLDILTVGPIPPNPSEILGSKKMDDLMEDLKKDYVRIVLDSPPVTAVTDAVVLAQKADGTILVIRAGDTPRQIVQNGLTQLQTVNAGILGAVLNGIKTGRDSYYYYQYYYYYYGEDGEKKKNTRRRRRHAGRYYEADRD